MPPRSPPPFFFARFAPFFLRPLPPVLSALPYVTTSHPLAWQLWQIAYAFFSKLSDSRSTSLSSRASPHQLQHGSKILHVWYAFSTGIPHTSACFTKSFPASACPSPKISSAPQVYTISSSLDCARSFSGCVSFCMQNMTRGFPQSAHGTLIRAFVACQSLFAAPPDTAFAVSLSAAFFAAVASLTGTKEGLCFAVVFCIFSASYSAKWSGPLLGVCSGKGTGRGRSVMNCRYVACAPG